MNDEKKNSMKIHWINNEFSKKPTISNSSFVLIKSTPDKFLWVFFQVFVCLFFSLYFRVSGVEIIHEHTHTHTDTKWKTEFNFEILNSEYFILQWKVFWTKKNEKKKKLIWIKIIISFILFWASILHHNHNHNYRQRSMVVIINLYVFDLSIQVSIWFNHAPNHASSDFLKTRKYSIWFDSIWSLFWTSSFNSIQFSRRQQLQCNIVSNHSMPLSCVCVFIAKKTSTVTKKNREHLKIHSFCFD